MIPLGGTPVPAPCRPRAHAVQGPNSRQGQRVLRAGGGGRAAGASGKQVGCAGWCWLCCQGTSAGRWQQRPCVHCVGAERSLLADRHPGLRPPWRPASTTCSDIHGWAWVCGRYRMGQQAGSAPGGQRCRAAYESCTSGFLWQNRCIAHPLTPRLTVVLCCSAGGDQHAICPAAAEGNPHRLRRRRGPQCGLAVRRHCSRGCCLVGPIDAQDEPMVKQTTNI